MRPRFALNWGVALDIKGVGHRLLADSNRSGAVAVAWAPRRGTLTRWSAEEAAAQRQAQAFFVTRRRRAGGGRATVAGVADPVVPNVAVLAEQLQLI